jgi:hypothetical protein
MDKLKKLIRESIQEYHLKLKSCSCGCNTCEITENTLFTLNENLAPREILSDGLKHHITKKKPLTENVYRAGSNSYFNLWAEARALYSRGILEIQNPNDLEILTETNLGEFGIIYEIEIGDKVKASKEYGGLTGTVVDIRGSFIVVKTKEGNKSYHESDLQILNKEGKKVPLDFPMEEENKYHPILEDITTFGKIYEVIDVENSYSLDNIESDETSNSFIFTDKHGIKRKLSFFKGNSIKLLWLDPLTQKWNTEKIPSKYEDDKVMNTFGKILVKIILPKYGSFIFRALNAARYRLFRALIYNSLDTSKYDMNFNDETMEIEVYNKNINEAKNKSKDKPIGKPMRGGPKKFYVYVRDPKTKKVKKVTFGDSGGLKTKINDPKARKAFAARHKCGTGEPKTSARYWSCRIGRYWKLLGGNKNFSGFW